MSYELSGVLLEVFEEVQVSPRFKKREFVVETNRNGYTEQIKFQIVQDKTHLIEGYTPGSQVTIHFDIKGNKWKDNYFVNLQAWKIEKGAATPQNEPKADQDEVPPAMGEVPFPDDAPEDDLPF